MVRVVDNTDSRRFDSVTATPTIIDVETTVYSKGHPFDPNNKLVSYACYPNIFKYFTDPDFSGYARQQLNESGCLVGFNIKFDLHWLCNIGCAIPDRARIWDCQLAEFVYSGQKDSLISLDECLERYDLPRKISAVRNIS